MYIYIHVYICIYIYIYIYILSSPLQARAAANKMASERAAAVKELAEKAIYIHIHIYIERCIYIYTCVYGCVCVRVHAQTDM